LCAASLRSCLTKLYGVDNQIEDPLNELAGNHWGNWTEPTVWTGFPEDVNPDGTIRSSSAASWSTTFGRTGQNWNGRSANTSSFANGAWQIFGDECYDGSHVHDGFCTQLASCETGNTTCISMEQSNQLFNRVGVMFANWIQYSRKYLGIKVSLGTETPMTYPPQYGLPSQFDRAHPFNATVTQRLYEGLFLRLQRSGQTPDFFNIWCVPVTRGCFQQHLSARIDLTCVRCAARRTQEGWGPRGDASIPLADDQISLVVADLLAAERARVAVGMPPDFQLGTQGWTLGTLHGSFASVADTIWSCSSIRTSLTALVFAGPMVQRSYFDQVLPPDWVLATQGENLGRSAVEPEYANISRAQKWVGPWIEDDNGRHAMESWVARTLEYGREAARYRATGLIGATLL
jgi:hypothetical protein